MIRPGQSPGFTLMELMLVIGIMASLLMFSLPVLRSIDLFPDSGGRDMVRLMNDLKKRSVEQDRDFILNMDSVSGRIWVTDDTMDEEAQEAARQNGAALSGNIRILGVEYPGAWQPGDREYRIRFKKKGYSDFALIHVVENNTPLTLKLEPFLPQVQVLDEVIHFEDCP